MKRHFLAAAAMAVSLNAAGAAHGAVLDDKAAHHSVETPAVVTGAPSDGFNNIIVASGDTYISGQPSEAGLAWLKDQGVTTVITVRTPHELNNRDIIPFDEKAATQALGMTFVNVPMGGEAHPYTPEALSAVAAAFEAAEGKVLLHCTLGWRASHVWAAYLVAHEGLAPNDAVTLARSAYMTEQPFEALLGGNIRYEQGDQ